MRTRWACLVNITNLWNVKWVFSVNYGYFKKSPTGINTFYASSSLFPTEAFQFSLIDFPHSSEVLFPIGTEIGDVYLSPISLYTKTNNSFFQVHTLVVKASKLYYREKKRTIWFKSLTIS